MTLKDTLDKITETLRIIQYNNKTSKEELVLILQNLISLVGQIIIQRDDATDKLKEYDNQLWLKHIVGQLQCSHCDEIIGLDFYVGSKGLTGKPISASTQEELVELLEFPPITRDSCQVPDFLPDL